MTLSFSSPALLLLPLLLPCALRSTPAGGSASASPWVTDPLPLGALGVAPALLPEDARGPARARPAKISALKSSIIEAQQFYDDAGQAVRVACEEEFLDLPMLAVDFDPDAGMWDLVSRRRRAQAQALSAVKRWNAIDTAMPITQWYTQVFTAAAAAESGDAGRVQSLLDADDASLEFCSIAFGALGVVGDWTQGCEAAPACSCSNTAAETRFCADQEREEECAVIFELFASVWEKKCRRAALSEAATANLVRASVMLRSMESAPSAAGQGGKNVSDNGMDDMADLLSLLDDGAESDDDTTDLRAAVAQVHKMETILHDACLQFQTSLESTSRSLVEILVSIELGAIKAEEEDGSRIEERATGGDGVGRWGGSRTKDG
jgi:hypothetical protein